jgi:hypothetical protein
MAAKRKSAPKLPKTRVSHGLSTGKTSYERKTRSDKGMSKGKNFTGSGKVRRDSKGRFK